MTKPLPLPDRFLVAYSTLHAIQANVSRHTEEHHRDLVGQ